MTVITTTPAPRPSTRRRGRRLATAVAAAALAATVLPLLAAPAAAVVGGEPIPATELNPGGDFEWLVGVELGGGGACSGTLIAPRYVLTAGHCENPTAVTVGSAATPVAVTDTFTHPTYPGLDGVTGDVQVLRLATDQAAQPLPMAAAPDGLTVGATVTVAGFGTTDGGDSPPAAGTMSVDVVETDRFSASPAPANSCSGDSGGPVTVSGPGGPVLVGVTSFGDAGCTSFAGNSRVAAFRGFIDPLLVPGNRPPTVTSGALETPVDTPVDIPIDFSDPDGPALTLADVVDEVVTDGSISGCAGTAPPTTCTFVPDPGFQGIASYRYTVSDGEDETTGTWEILVGEPPANQAPVVLGGTLTTAADTAVEVPLEFSDPDGPALGWDDLAGLDQAHGELTGCASLEVIPTTCTFQPAPGFTGTALVSVAVTDGELEGRGDWLIHVGIPTPPDGGTPPVVAGGTLTTPPGTTVAVPISIEDPESGSLGLDSVLILDVSNGTFDGCTVSSPPSGCTFTPDDGFTGTTFLRITATDGTSVGRGVWTIQVRRPAGGQPPVVRSGELTITAGATFEIPYEFSDPDGTTLGFEDIIAVDETSPIRWLDCASFEVPTTCSYIWDRPFGGDGSVSYTVADGDGETEAIWLIHAVDNEAPVALGGVLATPVDTPVEIPIEFSDPDGSPGGPLTDLDLRTDEAVVGGTITGCAGTTAPTTCTFTPDPGFTGTAWYSYTVSDGVQGVVADWVIHVGGSVPVGDGEYPQFEGDNVSGAPGEVVDAPFSLVDPEDGPLDHTAILDVRVLGPSTIESCTTGVDLSCRVRLADEETSDLLVVVFTDGTNVSRGGLMLESVAPRSSVSGTVTDAGTGAGLADVLVLAYQETDGLYPTDLTYTDLFGNYHFSGLPDGTYRFAFVAEGDPGLGIVWHSTSRTREGATAHVVTPTTSLSGLDVALERTRAITGNVTDSAGDPVPGVIVAAYGDGDGLVPSAFAVTDAYGDYVIRDVPAGPHRIAFVSPRYYLLRTAWFAGFATPTGTDQRSSAWPVEVAPASLFTSVDIQLQTVTALTGTVTGPDGAPVEGARVWAFDDDDRLVGTAVSTTASDGSYQLAPLAVRPYRILVLPPGGSGLASRWYGPSPNRAGATPLTPVDGTVTFGVDIALG